METGPGMTIVFASCARWGWRKKRWTRRRKSWRWETEATDASFRQLRESPLRSYSLDLNREKRSDEDEMCAAADRRSFCR